MWKTTSLAAALFVTASGIATAQDWNIEGFAGTNLSGDRTYGLASYEAETGTVYGLSISKADVFVPNLEIGLEVSNFTNDYELIGATIGADTAMVTAEYNFHVAGQFEFYGGGGVGLIFAEHVAHSGEVLAEDTVSGATLVIGTRYKLTEATKVFVEGRYTESFSDAIIGAEGQAVETFSKAIVAGMRFSF